MTMMMVEGYPWDVTRVPNYHSAPTVAIEQADRLDAGTFWRRYVLRNRPCLVKGAVADWPATSKWAVPDYVIARIGDVEARANTRPKIEGFGLRSAEQDARAHQRTHEGLLPPDRVRNLLPRLRRRDDDVLFVELRPADPGCAVLAEDLSVGGARFPFLPDPPKPRFFYSGWAVMFYKNSYSDWHFHPGADAMMCQPLGTKDVLLMPPTQRSWDQIVPIHVEQWKVYDVDETRAPSYRDMRPLHVVVERGDGLFIPVNWWHAVQARPREYGITTPITWDSPYVDLRQPATRHFLRTLWPRRKKLASRILLDAARRTVVQVGRDMADAVTRA